MPELTSRSELYEGQLGAILGDVEHVSYVTNLPERFPNDWSWDNSKMVTYAGIGDTFVTVFNEEPYVTSMLHEVPYEDDVEGFTERETVLGTAILSRVIL